MSKSPLRIGLIGCGNIGARIHLPTWLAHPEVAQVVALADPTPAALLSARELAGLPEDQVHADPLDLIARADVDVVDICTPQHLRRDLLIDAAKSGKHVLCEKPIAAVPSDAAAAVAEANAAGTTLAMVHNYLWLPEIRAARKVIDSGEIGTVRAVLVNFLGVVDSPGAAAYRANWRHDATSSGGGVLIDMLHGVYLAEALLGQQLQRVSAYVGTANPGEHVEDIALCRFETASNAALVNIAWGVGPGGIEISGARGRVAIRYEHGATAPWAPLEGVYVSTDGAPRAVLQPDGPQPDVTGIPRPILDSFEYVLLDFADAVRAGRAPTASGSDGQRILEATVGAYKSAATGAVVSIPLDPQDPVFLDGVLGLKQLDLPEWSPLRHSSLYDSGIAG